MAAERPRRDQTLRGLLFACVVAVLAAMFGWWLRELGNGLSQVAIERDRAKLALKQERDTSEGLAKELAAARREAETQAAAAKKAADRTAETQQLAEMQQALKQEHDKAEGLAKELAAARREAETQAAAVKKAADR